LSCSVKEVTVGQICKIVGKYTEVGGKKQGGRVGPTFLSVKVDSQE
jgi:hypothetical protein